MDKHGTEPPIRDLVTLVSFRKNIIKIFLINSDGRNEKVQPSPGLKRLDKYLQKRLS